MLRNVKFAKTRKTILNLIFKNNYSNFSLFCLIYSTWIRLQFMSLALYDVALFAELYTITPQSIVHIYLVYHSVCPLVGIGTPPLPLSRKRVRGWGSPDSDDRRKSLALCLLCALHCSLKLKFPLNLSAMSENEEELFYELSHLCKKLQNVC